MPDAKFYLTRNKDSSLAWLEGGRIHGDLLGKIRAIAQSCFPPTKMLLEIRHTDTYMYHMSSRYS
jgi:hypothetical protein